MKRAERQDGLRRLVTLTAESDDDLQALAASLPHCTLEGRLELAERLARRVLADAELPTSVGRWRKFPDDGGRIEPAPPDCQQVVFDKNDPDPKARYPDHWVLVGLAELAEPKPSLTHDAAMVLGFAAAVRKALEGGVEPVELARWAMRLGESFEHLRLSVVNGWLLADTGLRHDRGRKHGSENTAKNAERERIVKQRILDRVIANNPNPPKLEVWFQDFATLHNKERPKAEKLSVDTAKAFYYRQKRLRG